MWHRLCTYIHIFPSLAPFTSRVALPQEGMTRERGAVRVVQQAKRYNAMPQVIVSRNDNEEVWIAAPSGNLLAECFFKAPDETPEELEHMGYPQLLHLYPAEEILVGQGIAPDEVEDIFVEA